jgi:excisionase family DNA binding protein
MGTKAGGHEIGGRRLLMTYAEAARALAVSPRYLRGLVYQGVIPAVRLGRLRRIAMEDLTSFVEELRNGMHTRTHPTPPSRAPEQRSLGRSQEGVAHAHTVDAIGCLNRGA